MSTQSTVAFCARHLHRLAITSAICSGLLCSTFGGRKAAAQRVDPADFQEFMIRMQQVYDRHYATAKAGAPAANTFSASCRSGTASAGRSC